MMRDVDSSKKGVQLLILSSPIGLHSNNFTVESMLNKALKLMKFLKNFRLMLNQIKPCKLAIIIYETNIIFLSCPLNLVQVPIYQRRQVLEARKKY
jgi:hypothetical protein